MAKWFKVCPVQDLKPGRAASVSLYARPYAVFNVDGKLYGMDGGCAHMKANLAAGQLYGNIVECAMHGWEYDVTTGECLTIPEIRLRTFPVKIEGDFVWIDIEKPADDEAL
jgi:nitrite reductase/ring-hydroxylating ferredoxin subunit